jgi:hypothetical protein
LQFFAYVSMSVIVPSGDFGWLGKIGTKRN